MKKEKGTFIIKVRIFSITDIIMIGICVVLLFLTQSPFGSSNYPLLYTIYQAIVFCICIFIIYKNRLKLTFDKQELYTYGLVLLPYVALMIISIFQSQMSGSIALNTTLRENFYPILMCLAAIVAYKFYKYKIVDIFFYACCLNYIVYIFEFLKKFGFSGLLNFIAISDSAQIGEKILEVHEISFIFGLLLLYYILTWKKKKSLGKCIACAIGILLGYKRILFFALFLTGILYLFFNHKKSKKKTICYSIVLLTICAGWLFFVTSDLYYVVAMNLNIELNSRTFTNSGIYGRLNGYYTMSPTYFGHGIGFVQSIMTAYKERYNALTTGFHNDILKYYIDIGFIPWVLLFLNWTVLNARRILKKYSTEKANKFLCLLGVTLFCWTTDNLASYPNYLFVQFFLFFSILLDKDDNIESLKQ